MGEMVIEYCPAGMGGSELLCWKRACVVEIKELCRRGAGAI